MSLDSPVQSLKSDIGLHAKSVSKRFGNTIALKDASFELRRGEIHVLAGENGSGKSTLVKILSGIHAPNNGTIEVGEQNVLLSNPRLAQSFGIATVFQEVLAVENQTVLDNLWLGADGFFRFSVGKEERRHLAEETLAQLLKEPPSLETKLENLSLSDRQACAIARAVLRRPKVLILDEATSALDYEARTKLFAVIKRLAGEGTAILLITHRMDEMEEIGDRITVMRAGNTVATLDRGSWKQQDLIRLMTGSEHLVQASVRQERVDADNRYEPVLAVGRREAGTDDSDPVVFHRGEIVGLAGLEGHGQDDFLRSLHGQVKNRGVVRIYEDESRIKIRNPKVAQSAGIAYVAKDRRGESIFPWMSILENFSLPTMSKDSTAVWYSKSRSETRFSDFADLLKIKLRQPSDKIVTLSGGNQQKVIIARWLASNPSILLLNDPTRGIDINAKRDLYRLLVQLASQGTTVVMLSTEVEEHVELMDRVLVFREGRISNEISRNRLTPQNLVTAFFGEISEAQNVN